MGPTTKRSRAGSLPPLFSILSERARLQACHLRPRLMCESGVSRTAQNRSTSASARRRPALFPVRRDDPVPRAHDARRAHRRREAHDRRRSRRLRRRDVPALQLLRPG